MCVCACGAYQGEREKKLAVSGISWELPRAPWYPYWVDRGRGKASKVRQSTWRQICLAAWRVTNISDTSIWHLELCFPAVPANGQR